MSTRDYSGCPDNLLIKCHTEGERLKSREMFVLTTGDPLQRPLPSLALLQMQWFPQRVMGMAGAADVNEGFDPPVRDLGPVCPLPTIEETKHEREDIGDELGAQYLA
jgi:hypothetical protein